MKKLLCFLLLLVFIIPSFGLISANANEGPETFRDVSADAWYHSAAIYCHKNNIINGVGDRLFHPHGKATRAMLVTVLGAMNGIDKSQYANDNAFSDIRPDSWYTPYVNWAAEYNITAGVGGGRFAPDGILSREQTACFLYGYASKLGVATMPDTSVLSRYADSDHISSWAKDGIAWAVSMALIEGYASNIMPDGDTNRAQLAQIMMNFREKVYLPATRKEGVNIGSGRRLMFEQELFDRDFTTSELTVHTPELKGSVFSFDAPYEASVVYHSIMQMPDGSYRMYYKATEHNGLRRICYIESRDGLTWNRPLLLNNPYWGDPSNIVTNETLSPDNLFVFWDTNPDCYEGELIKGVYGQWGDGLFWEFTDDGNDFPFWPDQIIMGTPEETGGCFYDTLNTAYWSDTLGKYVIFVRGYHWGSNYSLTKDYVASNPMKVIRDIRVAFSDDFIHWSKPVPLVFSSGEDWQMYANAVTPYYRSKGLFIGMPTRYERTSLDASPMTDVFLMCSRDCINWTRTDKAWFYPDNATKKWIYPRAGYPAVGLIETSEDEMSFYMAQAENSEQSKLYRYTLRTDGFASFGSGTVITLPLNFDGKKMTVNCRSGENGKFRISVTDENGRSIQSKWQSGDSCDMDVMFDDSLSDFTGKTVRLRFDMINCDIYSFCIG
ncbi:MAG: S-layer homology domain-containing protein [Clostridia bacterium]|nr:S-layer homology domain-containing protein [Clostridia bacterium]